MSARKMKRHGGNRGVSGLATGRKAWGTRKHSASSLPTNWRDRLPDPSVYFAGHVAKLGRPNVSGWAQGVCPFHDDGEASLSVHLTDSRGGWRCFAGCGGGDLVGFHIRLTGLPFKEAVGNLLRGGA